MRVITYCKDNSFIRKKLKYLKSSVGIKKLQKIGYRLEVSRC